MTTSNEVDILDTDVSNINTDFPVLAAGMQTVVVSSAEKVRNNADTGDNIKIAVKTLNGAVSKDGEPISPGFTLNTNISLTPTDKYTTTMIGKAVATVMKSCGMSGKPSDIINNPVLLVGKQGTVNVTVKPAKGEWPEGNNVRFVVK